MSISAWETDPDSPFSTLLSMCNSWLYPENPDPEAAYEEFKELIRNNPDSPRLQKFKAEMRRVLEGDTEGLHPKALFYAASYDDGSDEAFLTRLWTDLYPDEPVPTKR